MTPALFLAALRIRAEAARSRLRRLPADARAFVASLPDRAREALADAESTPDDVVFALVAMPILYAAMVGAMLVGGP